MIRVENYLAELESLLADVAPSTREGLVEGIREELAHLSPAEVDERLAALGDPAFVAASVRDESPRPRSVARQDAAWYSVVTVLMLTIGGYLIPIIGWLVGLVLLWVSKTWTGAQKVVGTLIALVAPLFVVAWIFPAYSLTNNEEPPRWPAVLILAAMIAWLVAAIWLLVAAARARRS